jgi:hypothetical protein
LVYHQQLSHDAMPTCYGVDSIINPSYNLAHTGLPAVLSDSSEQYLPWMPYTNIPPYLDSDNVDFDPVLINVLSLKRRILL